MKTGSNLVLDTNSYGENQETDEFLPTLLYIFTSARWFGIPPYGGTIARCWAYVLFSFLACLEIGAVWKLVRLLGGIASNTTDNRGFVARLSGTIFYGNALLSHIFCWQLISSWKSINNFWAKAETTGGLYFAPDPNIKKRIITVTTFVAVCAFGGIVARLSGCIFYGNALASLIFSWELISSWKSISVLWALAETSGGLYCPPDLSIRRRVLFITWFTIICAFVEHVMSMISATGFDIPPEEYFDRYILSSHGFLLQPHEYSVWLGIPIFILSKLATILWNFQDLIVILISMGLTSRYHRLNLFVDNFVKLVKKNRNKRKHGTELYTQVQTWRRLREAYVRQSALVRRVDQKLGKLILLCNMNNFYFICLQLFLGINQNLNMSLINKAYYFYSLSWLLFRACSVVLAAADVNLHSKRALSCLYCCPDSSYNIEVKRLENQLTYDFVALSGMRLFFLDRQLLLEVAAAILKYELVMIQYDKE